MVKITQALALCAFATASTQAFPSVRSFRKSSDGRNLQTTDAKPNKMFEQMYFSEVMTDSSTVMLLEAGPFKLEASCKTIVIQNSYSSWYSDSAYVFPTSSTSLNFTSYSMSSFPTSTYTTSRRFANSTGSYSFTNTWGTDDWDPNGNYTESFLALDLTYTAPEADYLYGSPAWWYSHPNETVMVGGYEAGETRTSTVFRGYDGSWSGDFVLQSTSGNYIGIDGGETIGIHREHTQWLPQGNDSFPEGVECMTAGFLTYHIQFEK